MSRFQPELKPTVRKLPVSARRSPTRFPYVSSISPRQSVDAADSDMKWTVDMIRGITIPCSQRDSDRTRGNKSVENIERSPCTVKEHEKLNQRNVSLQKVVNQLRDEIKEKNKTTLELQEKLSKNETELKTAVTEHENIVKKHDSHLEVLYKEIKELKTLVSEKTKETEEARNEVDETKKQREAKVDNIMQKTDLQISSLCESHKKEMAERDGKLAFLKTQLESALNSNSKERQRQLDELTKELTRVTDETEMLKAKLRALAKQKQNDKCRNCASLEEVLQVKLNEIRQKDGSIVELLKHCQKMSVQLSRTDEFVKLLEENKLKYG